MSRPGHVVVSATGFAVCAHCDARAGLPRRPDEFVEALEDFVTRHEKCPAPPEVCEHAVLKRSCDRCAMAAELVEARALLARAAAELPRVLPHAPTCEVPRLAAREIHAPDACSCGEYERRDRVTRLIIDIAQARGGT